MKKAGEGLSFHKMFLHDGKEYIIEDECEDKEKRESIFQNLYRAFGLCPQQDLYFCMIIKQTKDNNIQ